VGWDTVGLAGEMRGPLTVGTKGRGSVVEREGRSGSVEGVKRGLAGEHVFFSLCAVHKILVHASGACLLSEGGAQFKAGRERSSRRRFVVGGGLVVPVEMARRRRGEFVIKVVIGVSITVTITIHSAVTVRVGGFGVFMRQEPVGQPRVEVTQPVEELSRAGGGTVSFGIVRLASGVDVKRGVGGGVGDIQGPSEVQGARQRIILAARQLRNRRRVDCRVAVR
jgi:hypothetical protein